MTISVIPSDYTTRNNAAPVLGIDLGSRNVKICVMYGSEIHDTKVIETVSFYRDYGQVTEAGFTINFNSLGIPPLSDITATGYGRMSASLLGAKNISELTAHAQGAIYQSGINSFTLLDMGGQDFKIIKVSEGRMTDMATNDKCAASTGRYLENMARTLGISLSELGQFHANPEHLTSTCAIFGESELIGLMVRGIPVERLAAGVNASVVERVLPLLDRMGGDIIVMSGGVALNPAVVSIITEKSGIPVQVVDNPLMNGAIGCCKRTK